ncbi:hypothetical protein WP12_15315 [Sphingomonas sp. SRS2]|nr:hypothetical protein WP12_15315 [Sphingomonas sp. SRS2]
MGRGPDVGRVEDVEIPVRDGVIPGRLFFPAGPVEALLIYYHGGGWVIGHLDINETIARMLAASGPYAVLLVDYRLAPEFPFPTGLEDSWDASLWASANLSAIVGHQVPLVLIGDSAGGNFAAILAQRARDSGQIEVAAQVLLYPCVDIDTTTPSYQQCWDLPIFGGRSMQWFWDHYVPDPDNRVLPEISPLRATDLGRLAPAIIVTAEYDPLRDEAEAYAEALRAAGGHVVTHRIEGMCHGFLNMVALLEEPRRTIRTVTGDLGAILS